MSHIRNIAFDLGGVVLALSYEQAVARFEEIGLRDAMYLSYQCGVMKPNREIFEMMLRGQQAQPEETLFVDDGQRNVEVAAALGMHTLHPQNNEDWIQPLEQLLNK